MLHVTIVIYFLSLHSFPTVCRYCNLYFSNLLLIFITTLWILYNISSVNILVQFCWCTCVSITKLLSHLGACMFKFDRQCQIVFWSPCHNLYFLPVLYKNSTFPLKCVYLPKYFFLRQLYHWYFWDIQELFYSKC